ncbi:autotransporter domain-containing protein [Sphingomonas lacusdianchii]|uniref:autotransporter domain-containing protein n=1 Tax=Sphingomonas lacusdianchii TaxID=2917992 RepID=UPI001F595DA2|nr:autotransporter domain-containing protein [Sphingomonas sp. JXJ CY 53]
MTSSGGSFGLNKIGAGTLTLTGANSYDGATSVTAGTLVLGTGGSLVSTVSVASGATFRNAGTLAAALTNAGTASNTGTISGPVSNSGSFTTSGILTGGLTNGGTVIVSGGQLDGSVVNQAGSLTITGSVTGNATLANAAAAAVAVTNTGNYRLAGLFDNAGSLTNAGSFVGDVTNAAEATVTNTGTLATASQAFRNAGLLVSTGTLAGGLANTGTAQLSGTLTGDVANTGSLSVTGPVTGIGTLTNDGLADLGGTTLSVGALAGSSSGAVLRNGHIVVGSADTTTIYAGTIVDGSNTTSLAKVGTGTLILSGNNSYSGGTTVDAGTLQIGNGGAIGWVDGTIATNAALVFNRSDAVTFANTISGAGTFTQAGAGLLRLTGTNGATAGQFTGTANVNAGILAIDGVFGDTAANTATLNVNAGGTLHGSGSFAGSVTVNTGGIVSAGNSPGALTVAGNYTLTGGATSLFELGTPGVVGGSTNDLVTVGGNLTLGGTLSLVNSANAAASPVAGSYRLFDYGGALGGAFATITSPTAQTYHVFTDIPGQVNLLVSNGGQALQFWDGTDTTGAGPGGQGGTATWNAGNTNWTGGPASVVNTGWQSGVGIFGGTAGTVTLAGTPDMQGLQFTVDGYRLTGGSLNLTGDPFSTPGQSFVNVDGGVGATIDSALTSTGGSFGLNKIGAGTLTLTGANSYDGATSVTAGTLVLGTGGSLVSTVSVAGGATFRNAGTLAAALTNAGTASNTGTISGPVSNSGSFTTSGILTGGLTNGGTVIVSGGQIDGAVVNQAGSLTITGSATGNATLANTAAAAVAVTDTGSYRLAGLFDNAGSLTNAGSFLGDVTNAAGATVTNTGTLATASQAFRNAGLLVSTGTLAGGLANTGTAQLSGTLTGDVANTGSLSVTGPVTGIGTLTNDGLVDLGGTTLSVGALAGSSSGAVLRNGHIVIGSADTTTVYAGTIVDGSNTTSLAKVGTGTLILSGNNSYSGGTTVDAGTLHVTGTLASNVSVARGATLSGTGSVGGLVVAAGASVAPGTNGTIGALSVKGDLLFAAGSFYRIDDNAAGASDRLLSSGVATLQGGTVMVNADTGVYAPRTRYTILTAAGGVAGQFADVTANFAFLTPNLSYDANNAFLTLSRNDVQFSTVASTPNQRAAGVASQSLGVGGTLYDAIVTLSADQGRRAFDMLSGEVHASAVNARYETAHIVREAILDRLRYGEIGSSEGGAGASAQSVRPRRSAIWGQGFGTFGTTGSDNNAARLRQQHSGLLLGIDTLAGSTWRLGIAGGYTHSSLDIADRNSDASIDGVFGGAYAGTTFGATQLRLGVSYSDANLRTKRIPSFPTLSDTASSRYGGDLGQAFGEAGYLIRSATGYVEPFIGGAVLHMTRKGFAERGGASALTANSSAYDIATSTVGMQVQDRPRALLGTETPLLLRGLLAYRHAYGDVHPSALVRFAEADQGFTVAGVPIARDAMVAQGGIDWRVSPATTLSLAYTGQVGSQRTQDHGVKVNFLHRW